MHFEFPAFGHSWASSTTKMPSFRRWIKRRSQTGLPPETWQVDHTIITFLWKKKQQNEWSCDVRQNLFKTESELWWTLDVFFDKSVFFIPVGWPIVMIRIAIYLFNLYKIIWLNFEEVSFKNLLFWSNNILFKVQNNYLVFIILFFFCNYTSWLFGFIIWCLNATWCNIFWTKNCL